MFEGRPLSKIIVCARREMGKAQLEVAKSVGVSQAKYSRIEKGLQELSVYEWSALSKVLNLPIEAINYDFMDKQSVAEIRSQNRENGFLMPVSYARRRCIKVRYLLPLLFYIEDNVGSAKMNNLIKGFGINENFFFNLDNQFNLKFMDDFLQLFSKYLDVESVFKYLSKPECHGRLYKRYSGCTQMSELVAAIINNCNKYQNLFSFNIIKRKEGELTFSVERNIFLKKSFESCEESTIQFLEKYKTAVFDNLPSVQLSSQGRVELRKRAATDNKKSVYTVRFSA